MRKQAKQLGALLAVLAVLAAVFGGLKQYNRMQEGKQEEGKMILFQTEEEISKISYDYQGEYYTFVKKDDTWSYEGDASLKLSQASMGTMEHRLGNLEAVQAIEGVTNMAQYGLAEGYRVVQFETETQQYTFYVGDYNEVSDIYYLCKPSETTVYAVNSQIVNCFSRTPENLKAEEKQ